MEWTRFRRERTAESAIQEIQPSQSPPSESAFLPLERNATPLAETAEAPLFTPAEPDRTASPFVRHVESPAGPPNAPDLPPPNLPAGGLLASNPLHSQPSSRWRGGLEHHSTRMPRGSQIFIVEGRRFVVPRALLVQNSDVFLEISSDTVTTLNDDAEAFEDFVDVLMNPLESCLFQPSPPLRKILNILQISHKYCCEAIKNFARPLALRMTSSTSIRAHTGPSLPVEIVFRIGVKVFESSIYRSAWGLILEAFREHKMTARDLLNEGRHSGLDEILASALYEAMISGRERWDRDGLSSKARQALARGMLSCTEDWNAFVFRLASGNLEVPWRQPRRRSAFLPHPTPAEGPYIVIPSQCCRHARQQYNAELATISQIHAFFRVPSYDIIGRLSKIREELPDIRNNPHRHEQWRYPSHECEDCWGTVVAYAKETKALITSQLSLYFFEGQHRRSSETRYGGGLFGVVDSLDL